MKKDIMDCKRALKMPYKLIKEILNGDESLKEEMAAATDLLLDMQDYISAQLNNDFEGAGGYELHDLNTTLQLLRAHAFDTYATISKLQKKVEIMAYDRDEEDAHKADEDSYENHPAYMTNAQRGLC